MEDGVGWGTLDELLPAALRGDLEERLWRPIETQATLELLADDPAFAASPGTHPAIFADHGIVHVRDVALGVIRLVETANGVLLPRRTAPRRRFVELVGVAMAYIHDIGMVDMTPVGRRVHAIYAAHAAFGAEVDDLVEHLLGSALVRSRLDEAERDSPFAVPRELVVREVLSLAVAHSKTSVPAPLLDDRPALRRLLQWFVFTALDDHRERAATAWSDRSSPMPRDAQAARYPDPTTSFAWLDAPTGTQAAFADDVVDAVRALRAGDVLRQRGAALRTSGGFEVCMDARTAHAVCTLRSATGHEAYVITYDDPRGAGEANIRVASVTTRGDLRIAFHRGAFAGEEATRRAVDAVSGVVVDIQADVIPSFTGFGLDAGLVPATRSNAGLRIELERPDDRPSFADDVARRVVELDPSLAPRLVAVADVEGAAAAERARFYRARPVAPDGAEANELLCNIADHGVDTSGLDRVEAFAEVMVATIAAGEVVVAPGSPPSFVYVPTGHGLLVRPDGGYAPAPLAPWVPFGTTGVIRRAERNSEVVAARAVDVVMIPGEVYQRAWLRPLSAADLVSRFGRPVPT
jgi:hypothetical protein